MIIKEFSISDSLKSKGVTNLFLKDNEIIVKINDKEIKAKLDADFLTTINNIKSILDDNIKNNILKELIFAISKNIKHLYESRHPTHAKLSEIEVEEKSNNYYTGRKINEQ
jgi:hypothetical protein